jgi:hypothetical protein
MASDCGMLSTFIPPVTMNSRPSSIDKEMVAVSVGVLQE